MKVTVCYHLMFDIEVDKSTVNFIRVCSKGDHLKEGDLWNILAQVSSDRVSRSVNSMDGADGGEIVAVYDNETDDPLWENC